MIRAGRRALTNRESIIRLSINSIGVIGVILRTAACVVVSENPLAVRADKPAFAACLDRKYAVTGLHYRIVFNRQEVGVSYAYGGARYEIKARRDCRKAQPAGIIKDGWIQLKDDGETHEIILPLK